MHVYMDDLRRRPEGFVLVRTTEECLLLLRSGPADLVSLDNDTLQDGPLGQERPQVIMAGAERV